MDLVPVDADVVLYKDIFEDNRRDFFPLVHLSFIQSIYFGTKDLSGSIVSFLANNSRIHCDLE